MTFVEMLKTIRSGHELSQQALAAKLGISTQYLCDLEGGRRMPSVRVVEAICDHFGRGPRGRVEWHRAGARSHGWKIGE